MGITNTDKHNPGDRVMFRDIPCEVIEVTTDRTTDPWRATYRLRACGGSIIHGVTEAEIVAVEPRLF